MILLRLTYRENCAKQFDRSEQCVSSLTAGVSFFVKKIPELMITFIQFQEHLYTNIIARNTLAYMFLVRINGFYTYPRYFPSIFARSSSEACSPASRLSFRTNNKLNANVKIPFAPSNERIA